jgi:hypothetical protein
MTYKAASLDLKKTVASILHLESANGLPIGVNVLLHSKYRKVLQAESVLGLISKINTSNLKMNQKALLFLN